MATRKGACEDCVGTCHLFHGKKTTAETNMSSFFKIIIGSDFNEALFLPPKFAKKVEHLAGQETLFVDARGLCWTCMLSYYKGLLAFHKGWHEFSVDKELELGDLLVVTRNSGGYFLVRIYGRDGCEKKGPTGTLPHRPVKRTCRTNENVAFAKNPSCQRTTGDARKRKSLRTGLHEIQPTKENHMTSNCELYMMVDRDAAYLQTAYSSCLNDLSIYEMSQSTCSTGRNKVYMDGQEGSRETARKLFTKGKGGNSFASPDMNVVMKTKQVDSLDVPSSIPIFNFSSLAVSNDSLLINLPYCIPSITFPGKRSEGRVGVIIVDPKGGEWTGIYLGKFAEYNLLAPWDKINAENGIQPGDRLEFTMVDASLHKLRFDIVHKGLKN